MKTSSGKTVSISDKNERSAKSNRDRLKRMLKAMLSGTPDLELLPADGPRPAYRRVIE